MWLENHAMKYDKCRTFLLVLMFGILRKCSCNNNDIILSKLSPEYILSFAQKLTKMESKKLTNKSILRKKYAF